MVIEHVVKTPCTPEVLRQLKELSNLPLENQFEIDFVGKNLKWAGKFGMSVKQHAVLRKMYAQKTGAEGDAPPTTQGGDDQGLEGKCIKAEKTPTGYAILTPIGKLGEPVSFREAQAIVAWLDKVWPQISAFYTKPDDAIESEAYQRPF